MNRLSRLICPLFILITSICALGEIGATSVTLDEAKLSNMPRVMLEMVKQEKIAGAITLVATRDRVVQIAAVGLADIANNKPMINDTLFWIASMTKNFTATAFMMLVDEGKVSPDDLVSKYIPSFKDVKLNGKAPSREITIRDLMTHTSGIGEARPNQSVSSLSLAQVADLIAAAPMKFEPGERWNYGSGLTVVGRIIEIVSGEAYDDFLQKRILTPLGMKNTTFNLTAEQIPLVAKNYKPGEGGKGLVETPTPYVPANPVQKQTPNPSGGLFSCATDLSRFYQMVLNGGQLDGKRYLSEKAVKQMSSLAHDEKIKTGFTAGNGWGLGWIITREPQGTTASLSAGTFGHGGAFGTQGWIDPTRGLIYVMLIQRSGFGNGDDSDVRKAFQEAVFDAIRK